MTLPTQGDNPESYLDSQHIWADKADPTDMSPQDFYWWSLEQAEGEMGIALLQLGNSADDSLKFVTGMRHELIERSTQGYSYNPSIKIRTKIAQALGPQLENEQDLSTDDQIGIIRHWGTILSDLIKAGDSAPVTTAERISSSLSIAKKEIADARNLLKDLFVHYRQEQIDQFDLNSEDIEELENISRGSTLKEEAKARDINIRTVKKYRARLKERLGADSLPHAVRIAIESGILSLDGQLPDGPTLELDQNHIDALEMASRGLSAERISEAQAVDLDVVHSRLGGSKEKKQGGARARLEAKNRPHLIRRAFDEGVLTPDNPSPGFLIGNELFRLARLEADLKDFSVQIGIAMPGAGPELADYQPANTEEERISQAEVNPPIDPEELLMGASDNLQIASEFLHELTSDIVRLLSETREFAGKINFSPLEESERQALERASKGATVAGREGRESITKNRAKAVEKLGAVSLGEAVSIAIGDGLIQADWANDIYGPAAISDPRLIKIIELVSKGYESHEIASMLSSSRNVVEVQLAAGRGILGGADNRIHLIRRAIEERVVPPRGASEGLHRALAVVIPIDKSTTASAKVITRLHAHPLSDEYVV